MAFDFWQVFNIKINQFLVILNQNHLNEGDLKQNRDLNFENHILTLKSKSCAILYVNYTSL